MKKKFVTFVLVSAMAVGSIGIMASAAMKDGDELSCLSEAQGVPLSSEELANLRDEPLEESEEDKKKDERDFVNIEDLAYDVVDPDLIVNASAVSLDPDFSMDARATESIDWNIEPGETARASNTYSLEAGDIVTINCSYSPMKMNASVDFGLIRPDGGFQSVNRTNGGMHTDILIHSSGQYRLAIRNNFNRTVSVSGFVSY